MVAAGEQEGEKEAGAAAAAGTGGWVPSKGEEGKAGGKAGGKEMWDSIRILKCPVESKGEGGGEGAGDPPGVAVAERLVYLVGTAHVSKVRRGLYGHCSWQAARSISVRLLFIGLSAISLKLGELPHSLSRYSSAFVLLLLCS